MSAIGSGPTSRAVGEADSVSFWGHEAEAGRPLPKPPARPASLQPRPVWGPATLSVSPSRGWEARPSPSSPRVRSCGQSPVVTIGVPRRVREDTAAAPGRRGRSRGGEKKSGVFSVPLWGLIASSRTLGVLSSLPGPAPPVQGAPQSWRLCSSPDVAQCPRGGRSPPADTPGSVHAMAPGPSPPLRPHVRQTLTEYVRPGQALLSTKPTRVGGPVQTPALSPGPSPPELAWASALCLQGGGEDRAGARSAGVIPCSGGRGGGDSCEKRGDPTARTEGAARLCRVSRAFRRAGAQAPP